MAYLPITGERYNLTHGLRNRHSDRGRTSHTQPPTALPTRKPGASMRRRMHIWGQWPSSRYGFAPPRNQGGTEWLLPAQRAGRKGETSAATHAKSKWAQWATRVLGWKQSSCHTYIAAMLFFAYISPFFAHMVCKYLIEYFLKNYFGLIRTFEVKNLPLKLFQLKQTQNIIILIYFKKTVTVCAPYFS